MMKMWDWSPLDPFKITGHVYEVGDMILHKNPPEAKALLGSKYSPCYRIIKIINEKVANIQDPHGHVRRVTFTQLQPMHMSEYLLSVEPHVSSFGTGAKFNKEMLQKDDLMVSKLPIQDAKLSKDNIDMRTQYPAPAGNIVKHPYYLHSRKLSIP